MRLLHVLPCNGAVACLPILTWFKAYGKNRMYNQSHPNTAHWPTVDMFSSVNMIHCHSDASLSEIHNSLGRE